MLLSRLDYGLDIGLQFSEKTEVIRYHHVQTVSIIKLSPPKFVSGAVSKRVEGIAATRQPPMSYCKGETCGASYLPLCCNK
jgi:hypothetical protein